MATATYQNMNEVKQLLEILRKKDDLPPADVASANSAWNTIKKQPSFDPYSQLTVTSALHKVANTATAKILVDYANPYTLNARIPLAGSVNATYKLNPDGTLSEGSAEVQEKTFETVLSLFPISDVLKAASGTPVTVQGKVERRSFQAIVEKRALKITYSQIEDFTAGCKVTADVAPGGNKSFVVEEIGPKGTPQDDDGAANDNEITVTGKITLPGQPTTNGNAEARSGGNPGSPAPKTASRGNAQTKKSTSNRR
jgi:hypothetical protein